MKQVLVPLVFGSVLWSATGWLAYPRELWDVPVFWWGWVAATFAAGLAGLLCRSTAPSSTAAVMGPILPVMLVSGALAGRDLSLFPLGLVAMVILALPGLGLAYLAKKIVHRR